MQTHSASSLTSASPARAREVAVYVHWPFCLAKCPYCDFNSHVRPAIDQERWRRAYRRDIAGSAERVAGVTITSIFLGGGTPSLMEPATVATVLDSVAAALPFAPDAEITLEANPTSVEASRFRDYRAAGVNRLSLGMQALDDAALKFLGREHSAAQARAALATALTTFPRVSFDLIYARPGQDAAAWRRELREALAFGTEHLSLYQLTIEEGTRFHERAAAGALVVPDSDRQADLYEVTQDLCDRAGLLAYEVSNHARPGAESRHNLTYWRSGEWLGIGPGAHGRLRDGRGRVATRAIRNPDQWLAAVESFGTGAEPDEAIDAAAALRERVLMGLRLSEGVEGAAFLDATGCSVDEVFGAALPRLEGLVTWNGERLRATRAGRLVLNRVLAALLDD